MESTPAAPCTIQPTLTKTLVDTTRDAIIVVMGAIEGRVPLVAGRPPERERHWLIRSGYVFVYEEGMAQIKRWTDSVPWSPSRAFTNMLVYRQVTKRFKAGSRRVLAKKSRDTSSRTTPYSPRPSSSERGEPGMDHGSPIQETASDSHGRTGETPEMDQDLEALSPEQRKLVVGSLADSYEFKPAGLCKKTLSLIHDGRKYHIVSYYVIRDVVTGVLRRPTDSCPQLKGIDIQSVLEQNQYKFDIDSSGYYTSNPVKGEDENYRQGGRSRESREYSAEFDSSSSELDAELQSMNIVNMGQLDHGERQLPAPFPQEVPHGGYNQFPTNEGWAPYLSTRSQYSQQQSLPFSQQPYSPNNQQQLPIAGSENNFFISVGQYSPPIVSPNQQPRTMPDDAAYSYDSNIQFAGPANMEPTIPNYLNRGTGMDLSQYRIGRRDEGENEVAQLSNPHRLGTTPLVPPSQWAHVITPVNLHSAVEEEVYTIPTQYQPASYPWTG